MARNKIQDLRNHLFETLEALKDEDNPMDIDRAKAIASVSQAIINSAKIEIDYIRITGNEGSTEFIPSEKQVKQLN
jgi:hypothetical protein